MKQKGVKKEALELIKAEYQTILDSQGLTPTMAFVKKANEIESIAISGRTLYKIFKGQHVHVNTISTILLSLGKVIAIEDGMVNIAKEIEHEQTN